MKFEIDFGTDSPQEIIQTLKFAEWRINSARIPETKRLSMTARLRKMREAVENTLKGPKMQTYAEQYLPNKNVFESKAEAIHGGHGGAKFDG